MPKAAKEDATMILSKPQFTRREFLIATAGVSIALVACSDDGDANPPATAADPQPTSPTSAATSEATAAAGTPQTLPPTPACADDDEPTVEQTEGPYFTPNSPERASLRDPGMAGTALLVSGRVLSTGCAPIERALVDFWQCDNDGMYDNEGYTLRGHQFTDAEGAFALETILPGLYPGRTRHIHVKVQAPDNPVLTTQLYFPGEAANASDGIFDERLIVNMQDVSGGKAATFDFVLDVA
jgi:protocatechuate 3,4-dioxygenase beta subunit